LHANADARLYTYENELVDHAGQESLDPRSLVHLFARKPTDVFERARRQVDYWVVLRGVVVAGREINHHLLNPSSKCCKL
jgi:hypothetical protein